MQVLTRNQPNLITLINPKSPISEAYRTLRTNISFAAVDEKLQVIMVTSAGQGEGKSTTSANLAVVQAESDKRVLLIDADLRKPTVHRIFHISNRWGLTSLLSGQTTLQDVITDTGVTNLHVIPSGIIPPNPSEMLASNKMKQLLEQLREAYDVIIIDTPPSLAVTDAQIMATRSDGVIMVVEAGSVKREMAMKAKANLEHVQARILGVVLNNIERKESESYYYYYGDRDE